MKPIYIFLMLLFSAMAAPLAAAQDAAVEVKEGDVEHWIEYYKKERGLSNGTVTQEEGAQPAAPQKAGDSEASRASPQPAAPQRFDE